MLSVTIAKEKSPRSGYVVRAFRRNAFGFVRTVTVSTEKEATVLREHFLGRSVLTSGARFQKGV